MYTIEFFHNSHWYKCSMQCSLTLIMSQFALACGASLNGWSTCDAPGGWRRGHETGKHLHDFSIIVSQLYETRVRQSMMVLRKVMVLRENSTLAKLEWRIQAKEIGYLIYTSTNVFGTHYNTALNKTACTKTVVSRPPPKVHTKQNSTNHVHSIPI